MLLWIGYLMLFKIVNKSTALSSSRLEVPFGELFRSPVLYQVNFEIFHDLQLCICSKFLYIGFLPLIFYELYG